MSMTDCRECGQSVSRDAKTCPHCGVKTPDKDMHYVRVGGFVLGLLFVGGCIVRNEWRDSYLPDPEVVDTNYVVNLLEDNCIDVIVQNKNNQSGLVEVTAFTKITKGQLFRDHEWTQKFFFTGKQRATCRVPVPGSSVSSAKFYGASVKAIHADEQ